MFSRPDQFIEQGIPISHWLIIYLHNDMAYDRRANAFVGERKVNVRTVAAIKFENRPDGRAHLLALHVGGVTGDAHSHQGNKSRDKRVVSTGGRPCLFLRHNVSWYRRRNFRTSTPVTP
jgi:hypothetical protein